MPTDKKKIKKILRVTATVAGVAFIGMCFWAKRKKGDSVYEDEPEQKNPFVGKRVVFVENENDEENADGVKGHLEAAGDSNYIPGIYDRYVKRAIDVVLSFGGLVVLAPVYAAIALAIKIDDPGPVLFTQKRLGQNKQYFKLHKFRSMKMSTPHDIPTHMLDNPEQYITKVGKFLRKHSLDELPQIWDIFIGNMSVIGPRPGLWNQDVLIAERDKYGANNVKPGLTGWAQINGRDELEIPVKAKLDGEYVQKESLLFDIECFFKTVGKVVKDDSVVEGGTGEMHREDAQVDDGTKRADKVKKEIATGAAVAVAAVVVGITFSYGLLKKRRKKGLKEPKRHTIRKIVMVAIAAEGIATVYANIKRRVRLTDNFVNDEQSNPAEKMPDVDVTVPVKKVLITGADSYIGEAVEKWLMKKPERYQVTTVDMLTDAWKETDFSQYDVAYHVAGIAHADVGSVTEEQKKLYYRVNTDLAVEVAEQAKRAGVKQFIFMSSAIVYSGCKEKVIRKDTIPNPLNFYGDSKWQADQKIRRSGR